LSTRLPYSWERFCNLGATPLTISDRFSSYGFISASGVRQGARALSNLSSAAGRDVDLTQASLRSQAVDFNRVSVRVSNLATAQNGIEEARGLRTSADTTDAVRRATQRAVNRMLQAESLANAESASPVGAGGTASIADAINSAIGDSGAGGAIASVLAGSARSSTQRRTPFDIIASAATTQSNKQLGDIFGRQLPTKVQAGGTAQLQVQRRALDAQVVTLQIDPTIRDAEIASARIRDGGRPSAGNEGFIVRGRTGDGGGTLVIDMNDPNGEDGRLASADITGGAGSDLIMLAGANDSEIRAGAGNDFVLAEGNSIIYGGDGDDILIGNNLFGDSGDDTLFGNTLAVGGSGDDVITMFALTEDGPQGLAFAGDGDDTVIGESRISADLGDGNDVVSLRAGGFASGGSGDDTLTALDDATMEGGEGDDDILLYGAGSAEGGAGRDVIEAYGRADIDGGAGNDVLSLRDGGTITGGLGNDTIQAAGASTVSGGDGNDEITLLGSGEADAGEGNDTMRGAFYSTMTGGKGDDLVRFDSGGIYRFAKGDGADRVEMGMTSGGMADDVGKRNRVEMSGYDYADVSVVIQDDQVFIVPLDPTNKDSVVITRINPNPNGSGEFTPVELEFTKLGIRQVVTINGATQTAGPTFRVPG
jgi:Ca2+-binding RTX toxin-like protein